jgi:DNA-binding CsgD family transcriptional regulator
MTAYNLKELLEGKPLNDQECDILMCSAQGMTAGQIAKTMFLAEETVKDYRKRAIAKLGAKNITNAVAIAIGTGVVNISTVMDEED